MESALNDNVNKSTKCSSHRDAMDNIEGYDNMYSHQRRRMYVLLLNQLTKSSSGWSSWQVNRADLRVLPLLVVGFASYQLDRTNIASALTGNFASVISVDQNTINLGNQLMFLGVIALEIPSNIILHKVCRIPSDMIHDSLSWIRSVLANGSVHKSAYSG